MIANNDWLISKVSICINRCTAHNSSRIREKDLIMSIPVATTNIESCVIPASGDKVWGLIRSGDFASWWGICSSSACDGSPMALGTTHTLTFADGTVWTISITEISDIKKSLSFELISSEPASIVSAANHSVSVQKVTSDDTTFLTFESQFSAEESTAEAVIDSKYKKLELFTDLAKILSE